jgi:hypothetical protein
MTPKHGSSLNIAEIAISVFERSCLSRPVGALPDFRRRVEVLEAEPNATQATSRWQCTSQHVRATLADLYPNLHTKLGCVLAGPRRRVLS